MFSLDETLDFVRKRRPLLYCTNCVHATATVQERLGVIPFNTHFQHDSMKVPVNNVVVEFA